MIRTKKIVNSVFFGALFVNLTACNFTAEPARPSNLPSTVKWLGGEDGGVWVDCAKENDKLLKCKIFDADNGNVLQSGYYKSRNKIEISDLVAFDGRTLISKSELLVWSQ